MDICVRGRGFYVEVVLSNYFILFFSLFLALSSQLNYLLGKY